MTVSFVCAFKLHGQMDVDFLDRQVKEILLNMSFDT